MAHHTTHAMSADMRECISNCLNCYSACVEAINHAQSEGNLSATDIRLLQDCADICITSANFMLRGSELHTRTCALCAEICAMCAKMCARFPDDPKLQACLDACTRCADSCTRMAAPAPASYDKTVADSFHASDPPAQPARV